LRHISIQNHYILNVKYTHYLFLFPFTLMLLYKTCYVSKIFHQYRKNTKAGKLSYLEAIRATCGAT